MAYIGKITAGGTAYNVGSTLYGTCDTAANTAAKVAVVNGFDTLESGVTVHIKFTYSNTASASTLAIKPSSTGTATTAKNIYKYGTTTPGTTAESSWKAGAVISFTYDGNYWIMNDYIDALTVTQTNSGNSGCNFDYRLLLSNSANDTTESAGVRKSGYLLGNPWSAYIETNNGSSGSSLLKARLGYTGLILTGGSRTGQLGYDSTNGITLLLQNKSDNTLTMRVGNSDIALAGNGNTWDGTNSSLKTAVTNAKGTVTQTQTDSTLDEYPIIFGSTHASSSSDLTEGTRKSQYFSYNPAGKRILLKSDNTHYMAYSSSDITLTGNTWDGTNTSLKTAVTNAKGTVTQTESTGSTYDDNSYELLFSASASNSNLTESTRKVTGIHCNPYRSHLILGTFNSDYTPGTGGCLSVGSLVGASGSSSAAIGLYTYATADQSIAFGRSSTASGARSFAVGYHATASKGQAIAAGYYITASGENSTAIGDYTVAQRKDQFVFGKYNKADTTGTDGAAIGDYVEIVGNGSGTSSSERSNARTLDWNGNEWLAGNLTLAGTSSDISLTGTNRTWDGTNTSLKTAITALTSIIKKVRYSETTIQTVPGSNTLVYSKTGINVTGYTPIAIVNENHNNGSGGSNESNVVVYRMLFESSDTKATICYKNLGSSQAKIYPDFTIIYVKNGYLV